MTVPLLLEHFDELISTPEDVDKLNRKIIQLAIQGKLSIQDSADETAEKLLKRIRAEKVAANIKKGKESVEVKTDEHLFDLPTGWTWCRINDIGASIDNAIVDGPFGSNLRLSDYDDFGEYPVISITNIDKGFNLANIRKINQAKFEELKRSAVLPGDIIVGKIGSVGKVGVYPEDMPIGIIPANLLKITPNTNLSKEFILLFLKSDIQKEQLNTIVKFTAQPAYNVSAFKQLLFPLPPFAEQRRIVARTEELFAQTRLLAEQLSHSRTELDRLNESALAHLRASETPEEFNERWGFVCEHFELLTSAPEHIAPLRQSILELAVRGRLTRRDAGDESAKELLKRILEEKNGKEKQLPAIKDSEKPFNLPDGWEWARFPEIGELGRGKSKHRPRNAPFLFEDGKYPFVQTGDVAQSNGHIRKYSAMYSEQGLAQSRMWKKGTLCITIAANIAETGILEFDACFPDSVVGFVPSPIIGDAEYFQYFVKVAKSRLESYAPATAQKNINLGILQDLLIPLPPLSELKRIVKRVEQLLGWCDALEAQLKSAQEERGRLVESVLARVGGQYGE